MRVRLVTPRGFQYFHDTDFSNWLNEVACSIRKIFCSATNLEFPFGLVSVVLKHSNGIERQRNAFGLEICISIQYIMEFSSNKETNIKEAKGQVVYQLSELLLEIACRNNLPAPLVSGLCDYARLALKVNPPHWKADAPTKWDEGYSKTAYFIQFLQATSRCPDFIGELIKMASTTPFSKDFFIIIAGQSIDDLFCIYAGFKVHNVKWNESVCKVVNKSSNETFAILCPNPGEFVANILQATISLVYPEKKNLPRIDQMTLYVEDMDGVAHCNGGSDPFTCEIHLSSKYITSILSHYGIDDAKNELEGVIRHEMVHAVQSNGFSTLPVGLVEGIADYFRLKGGYPSVNWKDKPKKGGKWQNGYAECAYFLAWVESTKMKDHLVVKLNQALLSEIWGNEIWKELAGADIDELFKEFNETLQ